MLFRSIFSVFESIPIDSKTRNPQIYDQAFERIAAELDAGEVVCIFPEGKLTTDGEIDEFRNGIEKIIARNPMPVVPMALRGLWGSFFSHKDGKALAKLPKRFWSRVELVAAAPVTPEAVSAPSLQSTVQALRGDKR